MKIISKYRDYYDGCGYSTDARLGVYERVRSTIAIKWLSTIYLLGRYARSRRGVGEDPHAYLSFKVVGFCGKLYPLVVYKNGEKIQYLYSYEAFLQIKDEVLDLTTRYKSWSMLRLLKRSGVDPIARWFDGTFEEFDCIMNYRKVPNKGINPLSLFLKHKCPSFIIGLTETRNETLTLNPCLADIKFFKVLDAYSTYQELEMFINNEIVRPDDPEIEAVSDKIKAESHGFNKYSFRKDKKRKKK